VNPSRLRVCLVGLLAGGYSGVPRYTAVLASALDEVAVEFPQLEIELLTTRGGAAAAGAANINVRKVPVHGGWVNSGPGRIAVEQIGAAVSRADLLHFFDISCPIMAPRRRFVTTVHDASVQHGLRPGKHYYKRALWPLAIRRASRIVAISEFARQEAVTVLKAPPSRMRVVLSGPGFSPAVAVDHGGAPDGVEAATPYLLYVGALAASKNLPFLIDAFGSADISPDVRLVLVGRRGDGYETTRAAIERSARRSAIQIREAVSDTDLDRLYRGALALVHPARYEGFGFTPLEAMARGCPVVVSDIPALRETAADGGLAVPLDHAAWAHAIGRVATDAHLRESLRQAGAARVASFSWAETARTLCKVFLEHAAMPR
jgi:glycosyltransferase involved in cell wall biosynthesis